MYLTFNEAVSLRRSFEKIANAVTINVNNFDWLGSLWAILKGISTYKFLNDNFKGVTFSSNHASR